MNRRKRSWELLDGSVSRERRYSLPLIDVDLSGKVKTVTLEFARGLVKRGRSVSEDCTRR